MADRLTYFYDVIPPARLTYIIRELPGRLARLQHGVALTNVVHTNGSPGSHVAYHHQHNTAEVFEQVFVPHVHAMRFPRLELGENSATD